MPNFKPSPVHIVRRRLESRAIFRGRETVLGWLVATLRINLIVGVFCIALGLWIRNEPLHVNGDVLPSICLQVLRHPLRICLYLLLVDGRPVGVPAVPTHWGCSRGGAVRAI